MSDGTSDRVDEGGESVRETWDRRTAALKLGIGLRTLDGLCKLGKLRSFKLGGRRLYIPACVREDLRRCQEGG